MQRYTPQNLWATLVSFSAHNAGFTLSVAYVLLTLCGIFYADAFYDQFGVSFLKFAETSDLLIVGISEPMALLMLGIAVQMALLYDYLTRKSYHWQQHWRKKPPSILRRCILLVVYVPKYKETAMLGLILMFVLYAFVFVILFAEWHSERVVADSSKRIVLQINNEQATKELLLLGTTANYLFTYDTAEQHARIYPVQNVLRIDPAAPIDDVESPEATPSTTTETDPPAEAGKPDEAVQSESSTRTTPVSPLTSTR